VPRHRARPCRASSARVSSSGVPVHERHGPLPSPRCGRRGLPPRANRWVHITTVRPSSVISRIRSSTAWLALGSRPDVGSSKSRRSGSWRIDRARARRVFMPVEKPPTRWSRASRCRTGRRRRGCGRRPTVTRGRGRRARRRRPGWRGRRGGRRARAWPTPRRSGAGPSPWTAGSRPKVRTVPLWASRAPVIMRMAVVLPAPLGPRSTVMRLAGTTRIEAGEGVDLTEASPDLVEDHHRLGGGLGGVRALRGRRWASGPDRPGYGRT
jgi:hypothetical protein